VLEVNGVFACGNGLGCPRRQALRSGKVALLALPAPNGGIAYEYDDTNPEGRTARMLADRWPADAPPPFKVDAQAAPDIAWVAWLGAAVSPNTAPARPFYLRAPDAKPSIDPLQKAAQPAPP